MSTAALGSILVSFASLTTLEIVLGIDNIVFISTVTARLKGEARTTAQRTGLALALAGRLVLLAGMAWLMRLTTPLFATLGREFSAQDLLLAAGGLFLIIKATHEIYRKAELLEEEAGEQTSSGKAFWGAIGQILVMDLVFSLDSIITALGVTGVAGQSGAGAVQSIWVIVAAMVTAVIVMIVFARPVSSFINDHPSVKLLALAFLLLVGVLLTAEAFGVEMPRGYVYTAMAFSLAVELVEMRYERNVARRGRGVAKGVTGADAAGG